LLNCVSETIQVTEGWRRPAGLMSFNGAV